MLQGGFQVFSDFGRDDFGRWKVSAFFQAIVFQPEKVQVHFVTLEQFFVRECFEAFAFFAFVAVRWVEAFHKIVQVAAFQYVLFKREVHVRAQIVDPEFLGLGFLVGGGLSVEEEHVRLNALRVEDSSRQP